MTDMREEEGVEKTPHPSIRPLTSGEGPSDQGKSVLKVRIPLANSG